jgi:hypothetical protein
MLAEFPEFRPDIVNVWTKNTDVWSDLRKSVQTLRDVGQKSQSLASS